MKRIIQGGLLMGTIGLAVFFFLLNPGESQLFPRCVFHSLTGYYCPGCGSQRAIHHLLHLRITGVIHNNFLLIPALLIIIYHQVFRILNRETGWKLPDILYRKSTPWIIFAIILIFWVLRNLPVYPFSALVPIG